MKKKVSGFSILISALLILTFSSFAEETDVYLSLQIDNPFMTVNGIEVAVDEGRGTAPLIVDGRTLLPIRTVIESFGGTVSWNGETSAVILEIGDDKAELIIGSTSAYYNGAEYTLDVAPQIINDRTMLPVRFVAESFGLGIAWESDTKTVHIIRDVFTEEEFERLKSLVPDYSGNAYAVINGNTPFFNDYELIDAPFEYYSPLDEKDRCGVVLASLDEVLMPTEERKSISSVTPTGWINKPYDFVSGGYLYNRCHLIGFQLTGENANTRNLITGTRYMNVDGMLVFENQVADYVKANDERVMYRVTPVFSGNDNVALGVLMEAYSSGDEEFKICVFCYNLQPGVLINYKTGESRIINEGEDIYDFGNMEKSEVDTITEEVENLVYRTANGKRYHVIMTCGGSKSYGVSLEDAVASGLTPCDKCAK